MTMIKRGGGRRSTTQGEEIEKAVLRSGRDRMGLASSEIDKSSSSSDDDDQ